MNYGKEKRLMNFFSNNKTVIVPLDDLLISGYLERDFDVSKVISSIELEPPSAILGYTGLFMNNHRLMKLPSILNISASTILHNHTNKILVQSVEHALRMNMDAVAVHVNLSSEYETEMLRMLGNVSEECYKWGMPLMAIIYPRNETEDANYLHMKKEFNEEYTKLIVHCARVASELGADIIKTQFTGCEESFKEVISAAGRVPVVIAGGKVVEENEIIDQVQKAMLAGAAGVSIGRNVFLRDKPNRIIRKIKNVVFEKESAHGFK